MYASLIALGLAGFPAAESAAWVAQLRTRLAGLTSLAVTFTKTDNDPHVGRHTEADGKLRLVRRPDGRWVGDLVLRPTDWPTVRYTLWDGKVYEAELAGKTVTEYTPADGDPLRFAADYVLPPLALLGDRPADRPVPWLTGRDQFYQTHHLTVPAAPEQAWSAVGGGQVAFGTGRPPRRCTVWSVAVDGYDIPRHLPRYIRYEVGVGVATTDYEVHGVRLNAADGPRPDSIADPTVLAEGCRLISMAKVWENVRRAQAAEAEKLRPRPKR